MNDKKLPLISVSQGSSSKKDAANTQNLRHNNSSSSPENIKNNTTTALNLTPTSFSLQFGNSDNLMFAPKPSSENLMAWNSKNQTKISNNKYGRLLQKTEVVNV